MSLRNSTLFFFFISFNTALFVIMFVDASHRRAAAIPSIGEKRRLVKDLQLTDLCLFTEASYTRHLSQADIHTAFQDSPMSLEHFPSGSIVAPPPGIRKFGTSLATKTQRHKEKL